MTALELKNFIREELIARRTITQEYTVLDAIIDFVSKALTTGIPDWTNLLSFNTDGTGAGKFTLQPDTDGKLRYWKTKVDANVGNQPPTNPEVDEDANWIEVSPGDGAAIPEWAPKIFGAGLVIVYYDITGTDPSLFKLTEAVRPFDSSDFETELAAGKWKKMTSDVGDVLDILLAGLSTVSTADVTAADSILIAIGKLQANKQRTFFKDGSQAMEGDIDMNGNKVKQAAAATANGELVNFEQLNAALDGLKPKDDCRAATVDELPSFTPAGLTLIADVNGVFPDQDDVTLLIDEPLLVKDETGANKVYNGIYELTDPGSIGTPWVLTRRADSDSDIELQGAFVQVSEGSDNGNTAWVQYSIDIDLGVTDLLWRQISSATPDATAGTKGKIKLAGDLGGTADAPTVPGLADRELLANKATDFSTVNDDLYPTVQAVEDRILAGEHFKGKYTTLLALQGAYPAADDGDYAVVDTGVGNNAKEYIWDEDEGWIQSSGASVAAGVTFTPAGGLAATNVQAALEELDSEKQAALGFTPENIANKDIDSTFAANSDTKYPSQKAVKTAVDAKEALANKDIDSSFAANSDTKYPSQKAVKTAVTLKEDVANKDTDVTLAANSDTKYPSQKAVKTHVATEIAAGTAASKLFMFNAY